MVMPVQEELNLNIVKEWESGSLVSAVYLMQLLPDKALLLMKVCWLNAAILPNRLKKNILPGTDRLQVH